ELDRDAEATVFYETFPGPFREIEASAGYAITEGLFQDSQRQFIMNAVSGHSQVHINLFFNYVESIKMSSDDGKVLLRSGDYGNFLLFDFGEEEIKRLHSLYLEKGISTEIIEDVEVDINKLTP